MNDAQKHAKIIEEIHDMFVRKNADYGNSFEKSLDEWGLIVSAMRVQEKLDRIKTSLKQELKVKDESVEDSFLDIANYAIMTVMWLRKEKEKKEESMTYDKYEANMDKEATYKPTPWK